MTMARSSPSNFPFLTGEVVDKFAAGDVAVGGIVIKLVAAGALNVGDFVFLSAAGKVNKSNTPANYQAAVGVVVGGKNTGMQCFTDWAAAAQISATSADNDEVLVQISGIAYVVSDAAVAVAAWVGPPATTAGRVDDGANAVAGQRLGKALAAAGGAAVKIPVLILLS